MQKIMQKIIQKCSRQIYRNLIVYKEVVESLLYLLPTVVEKMKDFRKVRLTC